MKILVTGGGGYIGSHTCKLLHSKGFTVITLDNLSSGNSKSIRWGEFIHGDIRDKELLKNIFGRFHINAVIHFAASAYVEESLKNPRKYYDNNVNGTISLLNSMLDFNIKNIVFSSSCATYGIPTTLPISESSPQNPINPYGRTKYFIEKILEDYHYAYKLNFIGLRYFNAAGADSDGEIGEFHNPETHLIPLCFRAIYDDSFILNINGDNFNTPDGTCLRDYIHVEDLASAHFMALEKILECKLTSNFFNLGLGKAHSILDIIKAAETISGRKVKYKIGERRKGDPSVLYADNLRAKEILGWEPKHIDLLNILKSAWNWQNSTRLNMDLTNS